MDIELKDGFEPNAPLSKQVESTGGILVSKQVSDDEWEKIQSFMPNPAEVDRDSIHSFTVNLANNQVDRDNERFHEGVLQSFAETLPGKGFLIGHQWGPPGKGLFYTSAVKTIDTAKWLQAKFYVLKQHSQSLIDHINAGIWKWVSIGFTAPTIKAIKDDSDETVRYWEYQNTKSKKAEALEGSLVWLGAQYDASIVKAFKQQFINKSTEEIDPETTQEELTVAEKLIIQHLELDLDVSTDDAVKSASAEVNEKVAELLVQNEIDNKYVEDVKKLFGADASMEDIKAVKATADKYHKFLVDEVVKFASLTKFIDKDDVETEKEYYQDLTTGRLEKDLAKFKAKFVAENPNYSEIPDPDEKKTLAEDEVEVKNPAAYVAQ